MQEKTFDSLVKAEDFLLSKGFDQTAYDKARWRNQDTGSMASVWREGGYFSVTLPGDSVDEDEVKELDFN